MNARAVAVMIFGVCSLPVLASEPLRLESGEPLIGIYYFTHWWEPWRSDDERIRSDLRQLRDMGFNTIFLDHEPSQMFDGEWAILDRSHRLAREAGFGILPWLEAKCGKDVSVHGRFAEVKRRWNVDLQHAELQDGRAGETLVWDPGFAEYMTAWISDYVDRYSETGAILRVVESGRARRVVSPCVEMGWEAVSFDEGTNERFREWLAERYRTVEQLNEAWGTGFAEFGEIDPRDTAVFDYSDLQKEAQSPAVTDHVQFRAEVCRDAFTNIASRLRARYPDLLLVAETPYEFGFGHPHAVGYRWRYAAISTMMEWADIILIRSGGFPSEKSTGAMAGFSRGTGIKFIYTHRISARQGPGEGNFGHPDALRYARQAAEHANGLGYYSWNEMVDTHMAPNHPGTGIPPGAEGMARTMEETIWLSARAARINQAYLDLVGVSGSAGISPPRKEGGEGIR